MNSSHTLPLLQTADASACGILIPRHVHPAEKYGYGPMAGARRRVFPSTTTTDHRVFSSRIQELRILSQQVSVLGEYYAAPAWAAAAGGEGQPAPLHRGSLTSAPHRPSLTGESLGSSLTAVFHRSSITTAAQSTSLPGNAPPPSTALSAEAMSKMDVEELIKHPEARVLFTDFARTFMSGNLISFLAIVQPYRMARGDVGPRTVPADDLSMIYDTYVRPGSLQAVPLSPPLVRALQAYCEPGRDRPIVGLPLVPVEEERLSRLSGSSSSLSGGSYPERLSRPSVDLSVEPPGNNFLGPKTVHPLDTASTSAVMLELAYLEVRASEGGGGLSLPRQRQALCPLCKGPDVNPNECIYTCLPGICRTRPVEMELLEPFRLSLGQSSVLGVTERLSEFVRTGDLEKDYPGLFPEQGTEAPERPPDAVVEGTDDQDVEKGGLLKKQGSLKNFGGQK